MEPITSALLFAGICGVSAAGAFFGGRWMARRALNPRLRIEPTPAKIGQPLKLILDVYPQQDVQVDQVEITLACHRTYDTTDRPENQMSNLLDTVNDLFGNRRSMWRGQHGTTEHDILCKEHIVYPINKRFGKGVGERLDYEVLVSPDGVGTKRQGELTAEWRLTVRFDIPGFPDAVLEREVEVSPRY